MLTSVVNFTRGVNARLPVSVPAEAAPQLAWRPRAGEVTAAPAPFARGLLVIAAIEQILLNQLPCDSVHGQQIACPVQVPVARGYHCRLIGPYVDRQ